MDDVESRDGEMIAVWLIEDDPSFRDTMVFLFEYTDGIICSSIFYSFEEVEERIAGGFGFAAPDVVLMDIGLPGTDGIEGVSRLKAHLPDVPIVMLTASDTASKIFEAFRAGASGYLLKDTSVDRIIAAIREAHHGGTLMPPAVASKVLDFFSRGGASARAYDLSPREQEVLFLMAEGLAHKQIADELSLSLYTVENHLRSIYQKLHVNSGIQAVVKAFKEGLL